MYRYAIQVGATGVEPATFGLKDRYFAFQFRPYDGPCGNRTRNTRVEAFQSYGP